MEDKEKYCVIISIICLLIGTIGFTVEYFIMNKFDIIWIIFLIINILVLFVNLSQKK